MPIIAHNKDSKDVKSPGAGSTFKVGERFPMAGVKKLAVGLSWELARKGSVDLDASCVLFDQSGNFMTSVYFGNLSTASCPALQHKAVVTHSGDNRDGAGDGDDETISVALDQIPLNVRALVFCVTSYGGDPFWGVQSAKVRMIDRTTNAAGVELGHFSLAAGGSQTALLMCKVYRDEKTNSLWNLHVIGHATEGRSFGDLLPQMQTELKDIIPRVHVQAKPNVVVLTKGESLALSDGKNGTGLQHLMCGLGWDKMGDTPIDLDASCIMFDTKQAMVDTVFFNRLENENKSVRHGGDNQTGEGEGDDEKIFMDLTRVSDNVDAMFLTVNSYKGEPFSMIKNAYMRVVDITNPKKPNELVRFQLNGTGSMEHTALLMVKIYRYHDHAVPEPIASAAGAPPGGAAIGGGAGVSKRWMIKALGYGGIGRMYKDNIKDCQLELKGQLPAAASNAGFQYEPLSPGAAAPAAAEGGCVVM